MIYIFVKYILYKVSVASSAILIHILKLFNSSKFPARETTQEIFLTTET